ncbi:unnamed protein product [Orchesella dallaii]|uniref:C2H2-type domain-containing protein n=1 Tax=Orchesella dallaii TaxID=48710 RepID=A0ABP1RMR4_9HEXA
MPRIPAKVFECTICVKTYRWKSYLIRHQNSCHISNPTLYTCTTCKKTFNLLGSLNKHVKDVHLKIKNYWCVFCEKQFKRKLHLDRHILSHIGEKQFWCNMCYYECSRKDALKVHRKQHTHNKENPYEQFRCETCTKSFDYNYDLTRHLQTHNPSRPRPYSCTICQKDFITIQNLEEHSQVFHEKIKKYSCVFCEKHFGRVDDLNSHIMRHIGEKPFLCNTCDKELASSQGLKHHKRLHAKQDLFKCNQCSKAYGTLVNLQVHRLNHEPKSFQCVICFNMFASNKSLELHILKHVNEKPFFCSKCDEEFKRNRALNLHMKRGQCKEKMATWTKSFSSKAKTAQTEKSDGQGGENFMQEDAAPEERENHVEISIPNVGLPGEEESGTLPLDRAPEAVPEANSVRENNKRPEVRVCEVCGEQFSGEKLDKDYSMHIIAKKHYLGKY